MDRSIVLGLMLALASFASARADTTPAEAASRAWAVTDTVLSRHVEPPARQAMLLAGIKGGAQAGQVPIPAGLARRVSDLTTPDQLATLLAEIWNASKEIDPTKREASFFEGLLSVVPGQATLVSEKERKVLESFEANLYVGIQVALSIDKAANRPIFQQILEGGPAENSGVKSGDLIESVDGVSTEGMPLRDVVDRLRGPEGSEVKVRYRRPSTGEDFTKPMTRSRLPRASIQGISPLPGKRWSVRLDGPLPIGYLKITEISGSTPQEIRAFAEQLEAEGAKALILDFRSIAEARFHPTVLLADALLDGGTIGRVRSSTESKTYRAEPDALFRGWPLVAITDGRTPAEVVWLCDALQDNNRARIIGKPEVDPDAGVREMVSLPGGEWSVQLTTGRLERADGRPLIAQTPRALIDASAEEEIKPLKASVTIGGSFFTNKPRSDELLNKAREILDKALKAAGK